MSIKIISSHTRPRLSAPVNHRVYAERHGYDYLFDATPYRLAGKYDQKLRAILAALDDTTAEFLVWIDDDAYFMQLETRIEEFIPTGVLSVCSSPVNPTGGWSKINSGVMIVRVGDAARTLFSQALATPFSDVRDWWSDPEHGNVCIEDGDQERILYQIDALKMSDQVCYYAAEAFNAREYHFTERADQYFVCHAASDRVKPKVIRTMRERFDLDQYLLPNGLLESGGGGFFAHPEGYWDWEETTTAMPERDSLRTRVMRSIRR